MFTRVKKLTFAAACLACLSPSAREAAAETLTTTQVPSATSPSIHHDAANVAHHHIHHTVHQNHHGLVSQAHQHSQLVHSISGSVQSNVSQLNQINGTVNQINSLANVMNPVAPQSTLANRHLILAPGQHHHQTRDVVTTATTFGGSEGVRLHHIPETTHSILYGNASQPITVHVAHHHHTTSEGSSQQTSQQSSAPAQQSQHNHSAAVPAHSLVTATTVNGAYSPRSGEFSPSHLPTNTHEAKLQMTEVVEKDYASWTGDKDKPLTLQTIGTLLRDPSVKGAQAAVLGVLAERLNNASLKHSDPSYSYNQLISLIDNGSHTDNGGTKHANTTLLTSYMNSFGQIASATGKDGSFSLYGSSSGPAMSSIVQGPVNDCYFLSTVESMLNQDPSSISKMITDNGHGNYTVQFGNGKVEHVKLTDGAIAEFSLAKSNGAWLAVLGLAVAQDRTGTNAVKNATPMGNTIDMGNQAHTLTLFTGQQYTSVNSTSKLWNATSVGAALDQAFPGGQQRTPIGVDTKDHALSIIGWDAKTQMVTIKNPWGTSGVYYPEGAPAGSGAAQNSPPGSVTETGGIFSIPLSEMLGLFHGISVPGTLLGSAGSPSSSSGHSSGYGSMATRSALNISAASSISAAAPLQQLNGQVMPPSSTLARNPLSTVSFRQTLLPLQANVLNKVTFAMQAVDVNESLSGLNNSSEIQSITSSLAEESTEHELQEGSVFVCHDKAVTLKSGSYRVHLNPGAAAFIVKLGDELGVFNLCDQKAGDVSVVTAGDTIKILQGHALILAKSETLKTSKPKMPTYIPMTEVEVVHRQDVQCLSGLFSYAGVFMNSPQIARLRTSPVLAHQKLTSKVLKTAAAITTIKANRRH